jgi:ATP:ADP antiporter, AAA family
MIWNLPARLFEAVTRRLALEEHERRLLLLMGALVAILFGGYTIAKVLRDALFLAEFGALALPYGYIGVALAAVGFVWLEARAASRFKRVGGTRFNQYAAIGFSILAASLFPFARRWTTAVFYVWAGSQAMMLLPHFWGLALDVWDSRRARSVFPFLGGCGLVGGLVGGAYAAWATPVVGRDGLMWSLSGLLIAAHLLTRVIERHRARRPGPIEVSHTVTAWEIIRRSSYIKVLAVALALSVIVSTLVDFQFKIFIQKMYPDPHALTQFFGKFYLGLNALALVFQLSAGSWLMYRLGLGPTTGLQPVTAMMFVSGLVLGGGWWVVLAMRWIQGVVFQTLGKSSAEIYYMAVRPHERRRIKPAVDTLVDRWSDAAVGIVLLVLLHVMGVGTTVIAILTVTCLALWIVVLFFLNREYGRAFEQTLSTHWLEPDVDEETMRIPSARKALLQGLRADDEPRIILALKLSERSRSKEVSRAVRGCLRHPSPSVRAAAVGAMEAMRLHDEEGIIQGFLGEPHEGLRRATVRYLLALGAQPAVLARGWLDGDDKALRQETVDALFDHPSQGRAALTLEWIDARLETGAREDLLVAARALGAMAGSAPVRRLRTLLTNPDVEVRRVALLSAARRPSPELLDVLLPLLVLPELSYETRLAVTAIGARAVPDLKRLLDGERGVRAQALAARTLSHIASPRAVGALMTIVRNHDPRLRNIGLQSLTRVRVETGKPVLPRSAAHKLFLRELGEYRGYIEPALSLESEAAPELRLLAETFRESAETALQRAIGALSCWYEPKPLSGAFRRLKSREGDVVAPALEYLGHVLPHAIFRHVSRIFEEQPAKDREAAVTDGEPITESIRVAWRSDDAWLRACAVRASRLVPAFDSGLFATGGGDDPLVRAELTALSLSGGPRLEPLQSG